MKYDIAAIETAYKGITFRSRLEATWAAFFDLCGWRHEYECDPIGGWLPDFWVGAEHSPGGIILVEVKPVLAFPEDVATKIASAGAPHDCLILGLGPFPSAEAYEGVGLGWLTDNGVLGMGPDYPRPRERAVQWESPFWAEAVLDGGGGYGVMHSQGSYTNRMTGAYEGHAPAVDVPLDTARRMWGAAKNQVRYRP